MAINTGGCFCDLHSSWQRSANESANSPMRQYFLKDTDLQDADKNIFPEEHQDAVVEELSDRPSTTLERTLKEVFPESKNDSMKALKSIASSRD